MLDISLYCLNKTPHLSMPVTGLLMLSEQKKVNLTYQIDSLNTRGYPFNTLLGADVNGKRVIYDLSDGYGTDDELKKVMSLCDYCFRRSFSPERNSVLPKADKDRLYPLGFHYHVSYPGNFIDETGGIKDLKDKLINKLTNGAARSYFIPERFEQQPKKVLSPSVMFYVRLWDPSDQKESNPSFYESVMKIDEDRIKLVRELKNRYGSRFTGGIQYSPLAMRMCRDLVVKIKETKRTNYLKQMKSSDICIGSTGLHNSIGWKTAEYIAASRAVVNEKFAYEVTGGFSEGKNYLPFTSADECLSQVDFLMNHPNEIYEIQLANQKYYENYLKPDALMANSLRKIFPGLI